MNKECLEKGKRAKKFKGAARTGGNRTVRNGDLGKNMVICMKLIWHSPKILPE